MVLNNYRHHLYHITGADVHILARGCRFRVHSFFLTRESVYWKSLIPSRGTPGEVPGSKESKPLLIDEDPVDFADFLWVFYNPRYGIHTTTPEQWITILRLATKWKFPNVRRLAISHLKETPMDVMRKVKVFQDYQVPRTDMLPLFVELASREELIGHDEFRVLEDDTKFCIARARETLLRASMSVEGGENVTNPIGRLSMNERSRIVGEIFGIAPPEVPDSNNAHSEESGESSSMKSSILGPSNEEEGEEPRDDDAGGDPAESSRAPHRNDRKPSIRVRPSSEDLSHGWHIVRRQQGLRPSLDLPMGIRHRAVSRHRYVLPYSLVVSFMCALIV